MSDLIERQAAIDALMEQFKRNTTTAIRAKLTVEAVPSAQPETRTFVELVVEYPDPELCTYKEFKGKPYYSIKYIENGETYVGYGTYKPEVLSRYLRECFMPSAQPEIIRCKDCTWWSNDEYRECSSPNYDNVHVTPAGFYCGYAERRRVETSRHIPWSQRQDAR